MKNLLLFVLISGFSLNSFGQEPLTLCKLVIANEVHNDFLSSEEIVVDNDTEINIFPENALTLNIFIANIPEDKETPLFSPGQEIFPNSVEESPRITITRFPYFRGADNPGLIGATLTINQYRVLTTDDIIRYQTQDFRREFKNIDLKFLKSKMITMFHHTSAASLVAPVEVLVDGEPLPCEDVLVEVSEDSQFLTLRTREKYSNQQVLTVRYPVFAGVNSEQNLFYSIFQTRD